MILHNALLRIHLCPIYPHTLQKQKKIIWNMKKKERKMIELVDDVN